MEASHHYSFQRGKMPIHIYITRNPSDSGWSLLPTLEQFLEFVKSDSKRQVELDQLQATNMSSCMTL